MNYKKQGDPLSHYSSRSLSLLQMNPLLAALWVIGLALKSHAIDTEQHSFDLTTIVSTDDLQQLNDINSLPEEVISLYTDSQMDFSLIGGEFGEIIILANTNQALLLQQDCEF